MDGVTPIDLGLSRNKGQCSYCSVMGRDLVTIFQILKKGEEYSLGEEPMGYCCVHCQYKIGDLYREKVLSDSRNREVTRIFSIIEARRYDFKEDNNVYLDETFLQIEFDNVAKSRDVESSKYECFLCFLSGSPYNFLKKVKTARTYCDYLTGGTILLCKDCIDSVGKPRRITTECSRCSTKYEISSEELAYRGKTIVENNYLCLDCTIKQNLTNRHTYFNVPLNSAPKRFVAATCSKCKYQFRIDRTWGQDSSIYKGDNVICQECTCVNVSYNEKLIRMDEDHYLVLYTHAEQTYYVLYKIERVEKSLTEVHTSQKGFDDIIDLISNAIEYVL